MSISDNSAIIRLPRRKNKISGSTLSRSCTFTKLPEICPCHQLVARSNQTLPGSQLFSYPYQRILSNIRDILRNVGEEDYKLYGCHSLRRGMAQDIWENTKSLKDVLLAGEWRSPAFLLYLNQTEVNEEVVLQAILHEDDDE